MVDSPRCPTEMLERIIRLEAETQGQREQAKSHKEENLRRFEKIDAKLDVIAANQAKQGELLSRGRGMGAVLASVGVAVMAACSSLVVWILTRAH